jgi:hypothetical protein
MSHVTIAILSVLAFALVGLAMARRTDSEAGVAALLMALAATAASVVVAIQW